MATALVHGNAKTERMVTFGPDEHPRSLQLYGSDPAMMGRAVGRVCDAGLVDHLDLNFGCPAAKVTRKGGGAAVPAKPALLRAIVRDAVAAAAPYGVPVTAKFRIGLHDGLLTHLRAGEVCRDEGVVAIALHARTVQQHYAGEARWDAIGELKVHVPDIPVLGNGDIWEASDAVAMMRATGCDGVVVGRGCLGRPWLFGDLVDVLSGRPLTGPRPLGIAADVMVDHARAFVAHHGDEGAAMRAFRKHTSWYLIGYPVGGEIRQRFAQVSSLAELDDLAGCARPDLRGRSWRRADPARPHQRTDPRRPAGRLPRRSRRPRARRLRAGRRRRVRPLGRVSTRRRATLVAGADDPPAARPLLRHRSACSWCRSLRPARPLGARAGSDAGRHRPARLRPAGVRGRSLVDAVHGNRARRRAWPSRCPASRPSPWCCTSTSPATGGRSSRSSVARSSACSSSSWPSCRCATTPASSPGGHQRHRLRHLHRRLRLPRCLDGLPAGAVAPGRPLGRSCYLLGPLLLSGLIYDVTHPVGWILGLLAGPA